MENENNNASGNLYPEVNAAYSYGWQVMKKNFLPLLLVVIVVMILSGIGPAVVNHNPIGMGFVGSLFYIFFVGPISYGQSWLFLKASRNEEFDIKDIFSGFSPHYWEIVLASLLTGIVIVIGLVFLIVPGIIFACRLVFVPYLVMDKNMKAIDAFNNSWKMTKGFGWKIFVMGILAFFIGIGGFILLFVGIFPASIWINSSFASFYHAVDTKSFRVIEV